MAIEIPSSSPKKEIPMRETTFPPQLNALDLTVRIYASDEDFDKMYLLQTMIAAYINPHVHFDLNQDGMPDQERSAEIAVLKSMFEEMMH
jgi:hypothetical protein